MSVVKPSLLPIASTFAAKSTPGERNTRMGMPGLVSYTPVTQN